LTGPRSRILVSFEGLVFGQKTRTWSGSQGSTSPTIGDIAASDTHYSYDTLGRLIQVSMTLANGVAIASPITTTYSFDLLGRLATQFESNGTISVTAYDATNHILELAHYHDSNANGIVDISDSLVASFAYLARADGNRIGSFETFADPDHAGRFVTQTFAWVYDAQDRLITETYDGPGTEADYTDAYTFDLAGNRVTLIHTLSGTNETTSTAYNYDANDRLLMESSDAPGIDNDATTFYSWGNVPGTANSAGGDATYQTGKTIFNLQNAPQPTDVTTYGYNLQARMSGTIIEKLALDGTTIQRSTLGYAYNDPMLSTGAAGIRYLLTEKNETDDDNNSSTPLVIQGDTRTSYLIDGMNPTGYAQVLAEIERNRHRRRGKSDDIHARSGYRGANHQVRGNAGGTIATLPLRRSWQHESAA
jgi:hypothetical protein